MIGILIFAAAAVTYPFLSGAAEKQEITQSVCPVSNKKIDSNVYTNFDGKRIYFCSEESKEAFLKNPDAYLPNLILEEKRQASSKRAAKKSGSDCGS
jgi:YHS domain-containing protein